MMQDVDRTVPMQARLWAHLLVKSNCADSEVMRSSQQVNPALAARTTLPLLNRYWFWRDRKRGMRQLPTSSRLQLPLTGGFLCSQGRTLTNICLLVILAGTLGKGKAKKKETTKMLTYNFPFYSAAL